MSSSAGGSSERSVPRLAPGWESAAVGLNPEEGFLLSRIDGHTSWGVLRQIGGLSPEEVDLALECWVGTGLVLLEEPPPGRDRRPEAPKPDPPAVAEAAAPAPEPDPALDLDVELQRQIFAFEQRLDRAGYHEILGVGRGAEPREIKRAYFQLSKLYHPDRYFRRNIGDCARRLDRIFKRLVEAYELLSDPTTRAEIERSLAAAPAEPEAPAESAALDAGGAAPGGYRTPTRMENLARLRRSFGAGGAGSAALSERRFRAGQFYEAARQASARKCWSEAAASVRLALAFDPWNAEYKRGFAAIQAEVQAERALALLEDSASGADPAEALETLEEVICYRPADVELQVRAAHLALQAGELEAAVEYAERACELEPEQPAHHLLRSRALCRLGDSAEALASVEKAAKLAPGDAEVEAERKRVGKLRGKGA